mmetsp:Transcript_9046/g.29951  ORF Transcript_9046/g.29951 Transcript_9046/m.29951 type:complete len:351 (+) Transcript_9046:255-1307(+)|eukprot:CAMPEP_0182875722 /NCGR_PEP_ID=MMETSP0034_2-20130328/13707_1 /TAXON_ID=156128 /ORGANISM="Nephroselmis pyriformis, Strain CCMP717" /LENGTH=350 /DNA_ID=CAMNT_0025008471 /DNA_START=55 /DNA_END=1107 /DNA_ORIENTATION=+
MGGNSSKEKALQEFPEGERYFGLENFGNTCYANSVLQALIFCQPLREKLLEYGATVGKSGDENLLTCLSELVTQIMTQKKKTGVVAPKNFVQRLKKDNELFRSYMHQDAHEFLNFLLNECCEILEKAEGPRSPPAEGAPPPPPVRTFVHNIFQGVLTNETRCLRCETVTSRDENFLDLSLDVEQNTSVSACLRNFSSIETLNHLNKFECDNCCSHQEAEKRMRVKSCPPILALHLKRFKYIEQLGRHKKLSYRVVFPMELKLCNTTDDAEGADDTYSLFGVVVHVGTGPNHGHYVSLVKSHGNWLFFDDETVEPITESQVQSFFGSPNEYTNNTDHGYILFYERLSSDSH